MLVSWTSKKLLIQFDMTIIKIIIQNKTGGRFYKLTVKDHRTAFFPYRKGKVFNQDYSKKTMDNSHVGLTFNLGKTNKIFYYS